MMHFAAFTFLEQLVLNATGPILTAVIGTAVIGTWATRIASRAQERREKHLMRDPIIIEISESAGRFYMELQSYWRATRTPDLPDAELAARRAAIDGSYSEFRSVSFGLEGRLMTYFRSPPPRLLFHRVTDLLTVRYFTLIGLSNDDLLRANAGDEHTGLTVEELREPGKLLRQYHATLRELLVVVYNEPFVFEER